MPKPPIDQKKIVIFSGAGISAESGISTYRDSAGLWAGVNPNEVASKRAWEKSPERVLQFFNERVTTVAAAKPNKAHLAVKDLESKYEVITITQNIDDLHERAGSSTVIHLHGSILEARPDGDFTRVISRGATPIAYGDVDSEGRQLRPNVVLFGEDMMHAGIARAHLSTAGKVLVVGTSLNVYPAAGLLKKTRFHAERIIVAFNVSKVPFGYQLIRGKATEMVPHIVNQWLKDGPSETGS